MVEIRNLIVNIGAVDKATEIIENLNSLVEQLNKVIVAPKIDTSSVDAAKKQFDDLADSINKSIDDTLKSSGLITDATKEASSGTEELSDAVEKSASTSSQLSGVWAALSESGGGLKNTINSITDSINMATVAIGALVGVAANSAFKDVFLEDAFRQKFANEEGAIANTFLDKLPEYVNQDSMKRAMMSNQTNKIALDQSMKLLGTLSQVEFSNADWAGKRTTEEVMSTLNSLKFRARSFIQSKGKTGATTINKSLTLAGLGEITEADIKAAEANVRASGQWSRKSKDKEANLDKVFLEAARMAAEKKIKPIDWDNLLPFQKVQIMKSNLENLKSTISDAVVPALVNVINMVTALVKAVASIPGAPTFLAYVSVFGALAVIISRLSGAFGAVSLAIKGATAAMMTYKRVALAGVTQDMMRAQGMQGPVQLLTGPKSGLNAPLMRVGNFLGSIGVINSVNAAGKVQLGILGQMRAAYIATGATSILSLAGMRGAWLAVNAGAKAAFTSMLQGAKAFFNFLMKNPYVALGAIIVAIVLLAYKWGYLQRAWDRFAKSKFGQDVIYAFNRIKSLVWDVFNGLMSIVGAGAGGAVDGLKSAFEYVANIVDGIFTDFDEFYSALKGGNLSVILEKGGDLGESLGLISPMFYFVSMIFRFIKALYEFLKDPVGKIRDFLSWIYDVLSGLWNWLIKAMPGAEKATVADEIAKEAEKYGLSFNEKTKQFVNANKLVVGSPSVKASELVTKWDRLPGFADGIAEAVADGISGIGNNIADAIKDSLDFLDLTEALNNILAPLQDFTDWLINHGNQSGVAAGKTAESALADAGIETTISPAGTFYDWSNPEDHVGESAEDAANAVLDSLPRAGSGGLIETSGFLYGHKDEPIVPAKIATSSVLLSRLSQIANSSGSSTIENNPNINITFVNSGTIDQKTKTEFTKLVNSTVDSYMSKQLRKRQSH